MIRRALPTLRSKAGIRGLLFLAVLAGSSLIGCVGGPSLPGVGADQAAATEKESWLKKHEERGGHTLERHVGKDETWLRARLAQDPQLSRASSFPDVGTAEKVIVATVNANKERVGEWLRTGRVGARLTLDFEGQQKIGIGVSRRSQQAFDCFRARVVLQSLKGNEYFILTAYPD